jgi:hypothetical protein
MPAVAQCADQGHHVQPELVLRQRDRTLRLGPVGPVVARAAGPLATAYLHSRSRTAPDKVTNVRRFS